MPIRIACLSAFSVNHEKQIANMGFVVLPALTTDISDVYDAYFKAFKTNPITTALFPHASAEDMVNPESEFRYIKPASRNHCRHTDIPTAKATQHTREPGGKKAPKPNTP